MGLFKGLFGLLLPRPVRSMAGWLPLKPWMVILACVALGIWYTGEQGAREQMSWEGVPAAQQWHDWHTFQRVLRNDNFLVGWSDIRMTPLWVEYRLVNRPERYHLRRPQGFHQDWRSGLPLTSGAYTASGYDRGHLAPNHAMATLYGSRAQQQTFAMTNVAPQRPNLNRKLWERLESAVLDYMLPRFGKLWVITGPVYGQQVRWLPSCRGSARHLIHLPVCVSVPEAFFKIIVVPATAGHGPKVLAFMMPQNVNGDEPLDHYLVSVADIEKRTGLQFFNRLPLLQQQELKTRIRPQGWGLARYANLPSRY